MTAEALADYIFTAKYARYIPELQRRETFSEAVGRMMGMHMDRFPEHKAELIRLERDILDRKILGSQRALQFGGAAGLQHHARLYNCSFGYIDRPRAFQEAFWLLLCGTGVGFSVQREHVAKLPPVDFPALEHSWTYQVPDTIEGWADALGHLLDSYFFGFGEVSFDYSLIRPEGSYLSSGTGRAPGPEPLRVALEKIRDLLDRVCRQGYGARLEPIDAYDVLMHAADAVLSGGVRRSATIALFSPGDEAMTNAKTGNWFAENPQRSRSNNSAALVRGQVSREQFQCLVDSARQFGEPGFFWVNHPAHGTNPCAEIGMLPVCEITKESGWQFCNLSVINATACETAQDFIDAAGAAARLGTFQAAYTDFPYLGEVTERITRREALLGVSITGIQDNPEIALDPAVLRAAAQTVVEENERLAQELGINPAARTTCVKPEGTTSLLLNTSSGCHPRHARRYLRRVQANRLEAPARAFVEANPGAWEPSVWSDRDVVLSFAIEAPQGARTAEDMTALDLLADVRTLKENWVDPGRTPSRCVDPTLSHNVSNTVNVREWEWGEVARYIFDRQHTFAGVSLLPASGDLDYPQAPFVAVTPHRVGEEWTQGMRKHNHRASLFGGVWQAVDALEGGRLGLWNGEAKQWHEQWIADAKQWLETLALDPADFKRIWLTDKWDQLTAEMVRVDYTQLDEDGADVNPSALIACSGGKCDLV